MKKLGLDIYKELAESFGSIRVALYYRLYWPCTNPTHPRIRADNCTSKFTTELSCKLFCLVNESTNQSDGMHLNLFKMINVPKLSFSKSYKVLPISWSVSCRGVGKECLSTANANIFSITHGWGCPQCPCFSTCYNPQEFEARRFSFWVWWIFSANVIRLDLRLFHSVLYLKEHDRGRGRRWEVKPVFSTERSQLSRLLLPLLCSSAF